MTADTAAVTTEAPPPPATGPHILRAIRAVMAEVRGFPKTGEMLQGYGRNARVQYTFQKWDDMAAALGASFRTNSIATQVKIANVDRYRFEKTNRDGNPVMWTQTAVVAMFEFVSLVDGSTLPVESAGEALDNSDKGTNKALTAAYKNACKIAFTLGTEDDQDPDSTRPEAVGERVRNAPAANGQQAQQRPAQQPAQQAVDPREQATWGAVENAARQNPEPNPEPSRLEIATRAAKSIELARTTGDLAELAAWALGKGVLPTVVAGVPVAHRMLAARATLPAGPPSPRQPAPPQPDQAHWAGQPAVQEPPDHGGY